MADIKSYPRISTLKGLDTLICTEIYDANADNPVTGGPTKTVTVDQVEDYNYFSTYAYNWTLSKPNFTFI